MTFRYSYLVSCRHKIRVHKIRVTDSNTNDGTNSSDTPQGNALRATVLFRAVKLLRMQDRSDLTTDGSFHQRGSEGWLVNGEQELVVQFRQLGAAPQSQWVELRTFRWVRPHPPVPQSQRRMLRSSAVDAWQHMLKVGWRRCSAPVR